MSYSNDAYAILSYVVDKAAGQSLESFLEERIFRPLGMTRTVLDLDGSEANSLEVTVILRSYLKRTKTATSTPIEYGQFYRHLEAVPA